MIIAGDSKHTTNLKFERSTAIAWLQKTSPDHGWSLAVNPSAGKMCHDRSPAEQFKKLHGLYESFLV
jgi:hypothetical protein